MTVANKEGTLSIVRELICLVNGTPVEKINVQNRLIEDLLMDSIELIDFVVQLEEMGFQITEHDIHPEMTVEDIVNSIHK